MECPALPAREQLDVKSADPVICDCFERLEKSLLNCVGTTQVLGVTVD